MNLISQTNNLMVHIHWASHARNQWSHARLHIFPGNKLYGIHKYTVFVYHIVIVYVRSYHNMVKKYCCEVLHEKKKLSLAWDHWFRAWDAQCMCTITNHLTGVTSFYIADIRWLLLSKFLWQNYCQLLQIENTQIYIVFLVLANELYLSVILTMECYRKTK